LAHFSVFHKQENQGKIIVVNFNECVTLDQKLHGWKRNLFNMSKYFILQEANDLEDSNDFISLQKALNEFSIALESKKSPYYIDPSEVANVSKIVSGTSAEDDSQLSSKRKRKNAK